MPWDAGVQAINRNYYRMYENICGVANDNLILSDSIFKKNMFDMQPHKCKQFNAPRSNVSYNPRSPYNNTKTNCFTTGLQIVHRKYAIRSNGANLFYF